MMKAIIFDWDGVLVDSFPVALKSFQRAFSEMKLDFKEKDLEKTFGTGAISVITTFLDSKGVSYTEEKVQHILKRKIELQIGLWEETNFLPGVEGLLKELLVVLDGGLKIAIASGNNREVIDNMLKNRSFGKFFSEVITIEDANKPKPAPDIFLKAAEKLGVDPAECVVFEDSPAGIQAAKRANMGVIAVLTGPYVSGAVEQEKPDLIVESLEDLDKISLFLGLKG